jgi:hypothetical protein
MGGLRQANTLHNLASNEEFNIRPIPENNAKLISRYLSFWSGSEPLSFSVYSATFLSYIGHRTGFDSRHAPDFVVTWKLCREGRVIVRHLSQYQQTCDLGTGLQAMLHMIGIDGLMSVSASSFARGRMETT